MLEKEIRSLFKEINKRFEENLKINNKLIQAQDSKKAFARVVRLIL